LSIGGSITGLVLALIAGATLFLLIRKKRRGVEMGADRFEEATAMEGTDAMTPLVSMDDGTDYVSQENPDRVRTAQTVCLPPVSHAVE
jgi:hypothetical protein